MKKKSFLLLLVCKIYLLLWSYKILVTPNFAREWNIKIPRFRLSFVLFCRDERVNRDECLQRKERKGRRAVIFFSAKIKTITTAKSEKSRIFPDDGTQRSGMKIQQLLSVCENERERYLLHTSGILFAQRAILLRNACDTRLRDRGYYDRDDVHSFANGNLLVFFFFFF